MKRKTKNGVKLLNQVIDKMRARTAEEEAENKPPNDKKRVDTQESKNSQG